MNWSAVRYLLSSRVVVHFKVGKHHISIADENGQGIAKKSFGIVARTYVIFIDYRLMKVKATDATDIQRAVLNPVVDCDGSVTEYHFRTKGLQKIIARLKQLEHLEIMEREA